MPQLSPALIKRRTEHHTNKQWGAVQAIDLSTRTWTDPYGYRRWCCHPKAVQAAYELVCHFDSEQPCSCLPAGDGGVKITIHDAIIYAYHLNDYRIQRPGVSHLIGAANYYQAIKILGLS